MKNLLTVWVIAAVAFSLPGSVEAYCRACGPDGGGSNSCYDTTNEGFSFCEIVGGNCDTRFPCGFAQCDCFLAGTPVETVAGPKPIEKIEVGDRVLSATPDGTLHYAWVIRTFRYLHNEYLVINGSIQTTSSQPFWVRTGSLTPATAQDGEPVWRSATELQVGDWLQSKDGSWETVQTIEKVERGVRTYNLDVSGDHTFFVHGYLVHNKEPCQSF